MVALRSFETATWLETFKPAVLFRFVGKDGSGNFGDLNSKDLLPLVLLRWISSCEIWRRRPHCEWWRVSDQFCPLFLLFVGDSYHFWNFCAMWAMSNFSNCFERFKDLDIIQILNLKKLEPDCSCSSVCDQANSFETIYSNVHRYHKSLRIKYGKQHSKPVKINTSVFAPPSH